MVAHLIITVTLLLSRDENVRACLPLDHSKNDFARKDVELATGLGAAIGLLIIEFMGFLSGLSMFGAPSIALTSIIAHATASVALGYFAIDVWDCDLYWWIFVTCSGLPALLEIFLMIGVLGLKKSI